MSSISKEVDAKPFTADVGGVTIQCESLADALILKIAEHAAGYGLPPIDSAAATQIVETLRKYSLHEMADKVKNLPPPKFQTE